MTRRARARDARALADQSVSLPPVAAAVVEIARDPERDPALLGRLLSRDAGLSVRLLRLVNSSLCDFSDEIDTLQEAINRLGDAALRSLVIAASFRDLLAALEVEERALGEPRLRDHAVGACVAATLIARQVEGLSPFEALAGGLLHDAGRLLMCARDPGRYRRVRREVPSDAHDSLEAERSVFGFDHAEVSACLLRDLGLDERVAVAAGAHHDPDRARSLAGAVPLASLLQVADRMCVREGIGRRKREPDLDLADCEGARVLGLGTSDLEDLLDPLREGLVTERAAFA